MTDASWTPLIDRALDVRGRAYAPYSHFMVGAAILAADGNIYVGANVENASYGLTICAERAAVASAIAAGQSQFLALAVATPRGQTPCGACLQVLSEFCRDVPIMLVDAEAPTKRRETTLRDLLPHGFHIPPT
jgi:cytidine deaminase